MRFLVLLLTLFALSANAAQFRSASTNATASTNLSITTPTGATSGDVLVAYLLSDEGSNTIAASASGWTAGPTFGTSDITLTTFYRTLSASPDGSYAFTNTSGIVGGIIAIDAEGGTPTIASSIASLVGSNTTLTTTAIANVSDSRVFIGIWGCDTNFTVATPPPMTEAHTLINQGTGVSISLAAYYEEDPADAGNITRSLTWSGPETLAAAAFLVSFTGGGGGGSNIPAIYRHLRQQKQ